ncbi:MAG: hypothetical protein P4L53_11810 [Candidatus Obscuribacterales bacterium]|nr:hypothetical protein [Candidatus Obscuribacterales bacterium]
MFELKTGAEAPQSKSSFLQAAVISSILFLGASNSAVQAQVAANGATNATTANLNPLATPTSINPYGQSSPLRPVRNYYPHHTVQNPSNPWLPPNLSQVNTGINPVGSISPLGTLTQPTSVLNNPNTTQNPGFPTVPNYNIGGINTPATQVFSNLAPNGGAGTLASPTNPGAQNVGVTGGAGGGLTIPGPNFP